MIILNKEKHPITAWTEHKDIWGKICTYLEMEDLGRLNRCNPWFTSCSFQNRVVREISNVNHVDGFFVYCSSILYSVNKSKFFLEIINYFKYCIRYYFNAERFEWNIKYVDEVTRDILILLCTMEMKKKLNMDVWQNINFIKTLMCEDKQRSRYLEHMELLLVGRNYRYKIVDQCFELIEDIVNRGVADELIFGIEEIKYVLANLLCKQVILNKYQQTKLTNLIFLISKKEFDNAIYLISIFVTYKYLYSEIKDYLVDFLKSYIVGKNMKYANGLYKSEFIYYLIKLKEFSDEVLTEFVKFQKQCDNDNYWIFFSVEEFLKNRKDLTKNQQMSLFKMVIRFIKYNFSKAQIVIEENILRYNALDRTVKKRILKFLQSNKILLPNT